MLNGHVKCLCLCQHYVDRALCPFQECHTEAIVLYYMDDILTATPQIPPDWLADLAHCLQIYGLQIVLEKVQLQEPFLYLGHKLLRAYAAPVIPQLTISRSLTLNQLQQWLGTINWVRPF